MTITCLGKRSVALALLVSLSLMATSAGADAGVVFSAADRTHYELWLHSLEQTVKARHDHGQDEIQPLYPFSILLPSEETAPAYRYLAISRALGKLESAQRSAGGPLGDSSFQALNMARNYWNLCEYDSALVWYARASYRDLDQSYRREIGHESLAAAVALGDSLRLIQRVLNTIGASQLHGRQQELILAYRYLLGQDDDPQLRMLTQKVAGQEETLEQPLRYWHAFALAHLKDWPASLRHLRQLLTGGGLSHGLTELQRSWVLTAVPDLLYLMDHPQTAKSLYKQLAASELASVKGWAQYQLGNLGFLEMDFKAAHVAFQSICASQTMAPWQEQACLMAALTKELISSGTEAAAYGEVSRSQP